MALIFYSAIIASLAVVAIVTAVPEDKVNTDRHSQWMDFKQTYNKNNDASREVWETNMDKIDKHNKEADQGKHTFRLGVNKFSDMTSEVLLGKLCGLKTEEMASQREYLEAGDGVKLKTGGKSLPHSVDWREQGIVTEVKDQGLCGSCYAFSVTGALEGQYAKHTGNLVNLSEQNIMDCTWGYGNEGCNGGYQSESFQYIIDNKGIDSEESYPYTGEPSPLCKYCLGHNSTTMTQYKWVHPIKSETALASAVATIGPISVAIFVDGDFFFYTNGTYHNAYYENPTHTNHAVLLVGYGTEDGLDYWIVKNSWGEDWGDDGYIRIARNKNNMCGIANQAMYPII